MCNENTFYHASYNDSVYQSQIFKGLCDKKTKKLLYQKIHTIKAESFSNQQKALKYEKAKSEKFKRAAEQKLFNQRW